MKKFEEKANVVRCVGGFRLEPANPAKFSLLVRLFGGNASDVGKLLRQPLAELLERVERVAGRMRLGVEIVGDPKMPSLILRDLAAQDSAEGVSIHRELKSLGIPLAATWQPDGRILFPNTLPGMFETRFPWDASLSRKENKMAAARHVAALFPEPEKTYFSLPDLLEKRGYDTPFEFGRMLYKYTGCGPWLVFLVPGMERGQVYYEDREARQTGWLPRCTGVKVGSIVEGSDVEVGPEQLDFPFTEDEFDKVVSNIDAEAGFYWERDNSTYYTVCKADGTAVFSCRWENFDDAPKDGTFDKDDAEAAALAEKAGEVLFEVGSPDYDTLIPIPDTEFFVKEDPVPDITF